MKKRDGLKIFFGLFLGFMIFSSVSALDLDKVEELTKELENAGDNQEDVWNGFSEEEKDMMTKYLSVDKIVTTYKEFDISDNEYSSGDALYYCKKREKEVCGMGYFNLVHWCYFQGIKWCYIDDEIVEIGNRWGGAEVYNPLWSVEEVADIVSGGVGEEYYSSFCEAEFSSVVPFSSVRAWIEQKGYPDGRYFADAGGG